MYGNTAVWNTYKSVTTYFKTLLLTAFTASCLQGFCFSTLPLWNEGFTLYFFRCYSKTLLLQDTATSGLTRKLWIQTFTEQLQEQIHGSLKFT